MKLTPLAKVFITVVILVSVGLPLWLDPEPAPASCSPSEKRVESNIPPPANLPDDADADGGARASRAAPKLPEVRFYHWAWNAQMGLMLATGGKQATDGSLMCKNGVNLKLMREDNTDNMQAALVAFAEALKKGERATRRRARTSSASWATARRRS